MSLAAVSARAGFVLPPAIATRDSGLAGNVVAMPTDGPSILFHNAAGVADIDGTAMTMSVGGGYSAGRYEHALLPYDEESLATPIAPSLWVGTDRLKPWYVGAGLYGTVGTSFKFDADPSAGIPNRFLDEMSIAQLGLVAGRELAPGLRVGVEIAPSVGKMRVRTPTLLGPLAFKIEGPGISGAAGLLYDVGPRTTVGVSYRSPGIVFMSGGGRLGETRERVRLNLHVPDSVTVGVAHRATERLTLTAQARWTDYPDFEQGQMEFRRNAMLNQPFIRDARATFRYGIGLEYQILPSAQVRAGISREEWMIQPRAMTPLLYDTNDLSFGLGGGFTSGPWTVDLALGVSHIDDRVVSVREQVLLAGRYRLGVGGAGVAVTYRFAGPP
ncbi:MAG: outer membrane protein transport protein [Candidatus Binatia bacterium]